MAENTFLNILKSISEFENTFEVFFMTDAIMCVVSSPDEVRRCALLRCFHITF